MWPSVSTPFSRFVIFSSKKLSRKLKPTFTTATSKPATTISTYIKVTEEEKVSNLQNLTRTQNMTITNDLMKNLNESMTAFLANPSIPEAKPEPGMDK